MERDLSYFETLKDDSRSTISNHSDIDDSDFKDTNSIIDIDITDKNSINNDISDDSNYVDDSDNINEDEFNLEQENNLVFNENNRLKNTDEVVLNLLELYVRHKWSKKCLRDTLAMLQKIVPKDDPLPTSVYKLFQYVKQYTSFNVIKHYYCQNCLYYVESKIDKCLSCNIDNNLFSFFFEIDICEQIKFMFENLNLYAKLNSSSLDCDKNIISDITDGYEYIRVNSRNNRKKYDLTLILNTDGLSLVKSSKSHC